MANLLSISTTQSGVRLSGSPIIFTITLAKTTGSVEHTHQTLIIYLYHGDKLVASNELQPGNQPISIDISSAVHGWFVNKKYDCSTLEKLKSSTQAETFKLKFGYKAKQIADGIVTFYKEDTLTFLINDNNASEITFDAVDGSLSEYAIYTYGAIDRASFATPYLYSLKPFTAEVVNYEEAPYPSTGRPYFAEEYKNYRRVRFYFINSLGTLESASLNMLEEMDVKYTSSQSKLYKEASFSCNPINSTSKTSRVQWKMSSGYCTHEWAEWWANDFSLARMFWMELKDKTLLPVTINVDTVQAYNKAKGTLGYVNFTVNSAIQEHI